MIGRGRSLRFIRRRRQKMEITDLLPETTLKRRSKKNSLSMRARAETYTEARRTQPKRTKPLNRLKKQNTSKRRNKSRSRATLSSPRTTHSMKREGNAEKQQKFRHEELVFKPKKQTYTHNGEEVVLELLESHNWPQYDNFIYVGKRDTEVYVDRAEELLQQHEFIVLRSFAIYVDKAFMVAGILAENNAGLKQITIPKTVKVRLTSDKDEKVHTKGAVDIELSLNSLDKKHIGYQESLRTKKDADYKNKKDADQKRRNADYRKREETDYKEKEQPRRFAQKKEKYLEKSQKYNEKNQKYIEKNEKYVEKNEKHVEKKEKYVEKNEKYAERNEKYAERNEKYVARKGYAQKERRRPKDISSEERERELR